MTPRNFFERPLIAICLSCAVAAATVPGLGLATATAFAADDANTVRPEIAKPLQAAQQAIQTKAYGQALAKLKEAESVSGRTPYEDGVITQLRLIAALGADEIGTAVKAFDTLTASGALPPASKPQFTLAIASSYYRAKDYAQAALWANRYLTGGGTDAQARQLLIQSLYLDKQYPQAGKVALEEVQAAEKRGQAPSETILEILASSAKEQQSWPLYETALTHLAASYPKPEYWTDLLHRLPAHAGFSERLALDIARLSLAVGALHGAEQYMEYAEQALQAGYPGEARMVVDKGYAAGILGTGADAARHGRLRDMVIKAVDVDRKSLDGAASEASRGDALASTGLDYYGYGQYDKAIAFTEQGIAKGGLESIDEARLHLGIIYLAAGKKAKAIEILKSVQAPDGSTDLAHLWIIVAGGHPF